MQIKLLIFLAVLLLSLGVSFLVFQARPENETQQDQPKAVPAGGVIVGQNEPSQSSGVMGEGDTALNEGAAVVEVDPRDPILKVVSGKHSSVRANPASIPADGVSQITVIVTARTEDGKVVAGAQANLESSRGVQDEIEVIRGRTGPDGQAIFLVRSKEAGSAVFTGYIGTKIIDEKTVTKFTAPPTMSLSLPPQLAIGALSIIAFILLVQYMFVRSVLDTRRFEEQELFFHHPKPSKSVGQAGK